MSDNLENTNQEPQFTEIEQKALEMGWRPKEEFQGDESDFIDAKEFVNRQPLFDKIEGQSKKIKQLNNALEALKQHYTKVEEHAVQKALKELKEQRKQALSDGDGEQFEALDEKIKDTESELHQIKRVRETPLVEDDPAPAPEWTSFLNQNPWYNTSKSMRVFADAQGAAYAAEGYSPAEVLRKVAADVRREFPEKFTNVRKESAPAVGNSRSTPAKGGGDIQLTELEKKIMNDLVKSGVMTAEKYIADLKAVKSRN